jgi:hypothetical protein
VARASLPGVSTIDSSVVKISKDGSVGREEVRGSSGSPVAAGAAELAEVGGVDVLGVDVLSAGREEVWELWKSKGS